MFQYRQDCKLSPTNNYPSTSRRSNTLGSTSTPTCPIFTPTVNLDFESDDDNDNDSDYNPFYGKYTSLLPNYLTSTC